jgi:hypothetical protein
VTRRSVHEEIESAIRVRHLQTSLGESVWFASATSEADAVRALLPHGFEQAPVVDDGLTVGFVLASELDPAAETPLGAKAHPLAAGHLVSADSSLLEALPWLTTHRLLFVLDGNAITGFVTPSDLNKQAGRTYFYLMLAELELFLAELIRTQFPDQRIAIGLLSANRAQKVIDRYAQDRAENVDADLVACLTFADVCDIAERDDSIREHLGFTSRKRAARAFGPLKRLRDEVMHLVRALLAVERPVEELVRLDRDLHQLVDAARRAQGIAGSLPDQCPPK